MEPHIYDLGLGREDYNNLRKKVIGVYRHPEFTRNMRIAFQNLMYRETQKHSANIEAHTDNRKATQKTLDNIFNAWSWGVQNYSPGEISHDFICDLAQKVEPNAFTVRSILYTGHGYRKDAVYINPNIKNGHTPPNAQKVPTYMTELIDYINQNVNENPLTTGILAHMHFARIHPFYDGNGRTSRMLMNLILNKKNLPLISIESVPKGFGDNIERDYYMDLIAKGIKGFQSRKKGCEYKDDELNFYNFMLSKSKLFLEKLENRLSNHRNFNVYIKTKKPRHINMFRGKLDAFFRRKNSKYKNFEIVPNEHLRKYNFHLKVGGNISKLDIENCLSNFHKNPLKSKNWSVESDLEAELEI